MKITLFTSNNIRHNYLINLLSKISNKLFVIQENRTSPMSKFQKHHTNSKIMNTYFKKVNDAQIKLFGNSSHENTKKNIKILPIQTGDLNNHSLTFLSNYLESDIYVVFGTSYIKGELLDFLVKNNAYSIHMGISPYYRGSDCNFWALYDGNPHLAGATIQLLSKGLDNGPILYHAVSNIKETSFVYTMSTVKAAVHSITEKIKDKSIYKIKPLIQNKDNEIRYSKKIEFNEEVVKKYLKRKIDLNSKKFDPLLLKEAFFLN